MIGRMISILILAAIVVAGAWTLDFLVKEPGRLVLDYNDRLYELTLFEATVVLVVGIVMLMASLLILKFLITLARFLLGDETAFSGFFARSRERSGMDALSKGMLALASGDAKTAKRKADLAERKLERPELTRLLSAQAAELAGDPARAKLYYKALMTDDKTAFIGTQGLLKQAIEADDTDRALKLANHAHGLKPKDDRTLETLYTLQSQKFDWAAARETVKKQAKLGALPKADANEREASLALAQAEDAERVGEVDHARALAVEAAKLDPANVNAAAGAAKLLIEAGSKRAASKLVTNAWRHRPHPKLAAAFAAIEPDEAPAARRRRFEDLFEMHPEHPETRFLRAELALVGEDWSAARMAIQDLREGQPTARSCAIMAAIARGEGEPDHIIRGWLARAVSAPRDESSESEISHAAMLPLLVESGEEKMTVAEQDAEPPLAETDTEKEGGEKAVKAGDPTQSAA